MSRFSAIALYLRERFPLRLYLPLSCFLAFGLMAIEPGDRNWRSFVEVLLLLLLLLFPFRLLDDLSSVEEDRLKAPERLLCRTEALRFFRMALYASFLAALCLLSMFSGPWNGAGYALLFGGFHLWYVFGSRLPGRLARGLPPLIKYPLLILLLTRGPMPAVRTWVLMVVVFAAFVVYEILHDPIYEREYSCLRGSLLRRGRIFRFLPFIGVMVWFGIEMAFR